MNYDFFFYKQTFVVIDVFCYYGRLSYLKNIYLFTKYHNIRIL